VILADVNVLIYAFRQDAPHHVTAKQWLDGVVLGAPQFGLSPLALSAVVRITTNQRVYKEPSTLDEVFAYCDNLLSQPHCEIVEPGDRHWQIFCRLCLNTRVHGPRTTDAWFAALAIEHDCTWITYDRDFSRFPGLDWAMPTALSQHRP
jgi:toxin-antitoxin system PIN domain toxin